MRFIEWLLQKPDEYGDKGQGFSPIMDYFLLALMDREFWGVREITISGESRTFSLPRDLRRVGLDNFKYYGFYPNCRDEDLAIEEAFYELLGMRTADFQYSSTETMGGTCILTTRENLAAQIETSYPKSERKSSS